MAWEISISQEGWAEIESKLKEWSKERLVEALSDDYLEYLEEEDTETPYLHMKEMEDKVNQYRKQLNDIYDQESLAEEALLMVERNNTCDNGGFAYWIDREGYHKVHLD